MKTKKISAVLKSKDGFSYILVCVLVLVSMMFVSVLIQYAGIYIAAGLQKDEAQLKLDSYMTKEAIKDYNAFKQGLNYRDYIDENELKNGATAVVKATSDNITNLTVTALEGDSVGVRVSYTLTIPFELWGRRISDIAVPVNLISKLTERN